jgi:dCTP deaminase
MILSKAAIISMVEDGSLKISPFVNNLQKDGNASYGLGYAGYDVRMNPGSAMRLSQRNINSSVDMYEPKTVESAASFHLGAPYIPIHGCALVETLEYFELPTDIMGFIYPKSTWARIGIGVITPPIEPGWKGRLTLTLVNHTSNRVKFDERDGLAQIVFVRVSEGAEEYAGKYQNADGLMTAKGH